MPLPARDFDPSEAAIGWRVLSERGHEVVFATPDGERAACDPLMLSGDGLDPWGFVPFFKKLRLAGRILRANGAARAAYAAMERSPGYGRPLPYDTLRSDDFDGLLLPGGHRARGMRAYLENAALQGLVADFFDAAKPVGAICHGVVLAARSISPKTGRPVLYGLRTTALTWRQERQAAMLARLVRFWDPDYYRTYPERPGEAAGYRSVQAEVTRALARPEDFLEPSPGMPDYRRKVDGTKRDSPGDPRPAFVVRDGNYVSARWPGDAYAFAREFADVLERRTDAVEAKGSR